MSVTKIQNTVSVNEKAGGVEASTDPVHHQLASSQMMITQTLHWIPEKGNYTLVNLAELSGESRFLKALVIAGTPRAVIKVAPGEWKVKSQSNPWTVGPEDPTYYDVATHGDSTPTCSCYDYTESHQMCKHIMAVELHATARAIAFGVAHRQHLPLRQLGDEILHVVTANALAPDENEQAMVLYAAVTALLSDNSTEIRKALAFQLRYWWPGNDPESLLDPVVAPTLDDQAMELEVWSPTQGWRKPTQGLDAIREHIEDKGLQIGKPTINTNRRNGRWEGLFTVPVYQILKGQTA